MTPAEEDPSKGETTLPEEVVHKDKASEAKACISKAKFHLGNSRNLKAEIKAGVTEAIDRLYQIVKELDKELKVKTGTTIETGTTKEVQPRREYSEAENTILKQLNEATKYIKENNLKIEELRTTIEQQTKEQPPRTYAAVTADPARRPKPVEPTLHSVLISSEDIDDTGEMVLSKIRDTIDAKEGWVKVERVRKARDSKVVLSVSSREDRNRIREKLINSGKQLKCEEINNKDPLLILYNILTEHEDQDILIAIRNQNKHIFENLNPSEDRIAIRYKKKARNQFTNHVVVRTSPLIWKRAIELGYMYIDLQKIKVEDQSPLVQCTRCLAYGHSKRFCKEDTDSCSHCGGDHLNGECDEDAQTDAPICINCKKANVTDRYHNAFSGECPIRKKWDKIARSTIAYN